MNRRGFTVVELIIVVTIMAVLLTLGVVNLRGNQASARDTERKTDIESIAQHLEAYYTSSTDAGVNTNGSCTGGTITNITTDSGSYTVHTFTSSGTLTCTGSSISATQLVVGGGGGGSAGQGYGGGGGAGGFRTGSLSLSAATYPVTVGSGGAVGASGASSTFSTITSDGGGRGGNFYAYNNVDAGQLGASGGGGSSCYTVCASAGGAGTAGQGYAGGAGMNQNNVGAYSSGGGGGAGGVGDAGIRQAAGNGGPGLSSSISGTLTWYAGGGAGAFLYETGFPIAEGDGGLGGGGKLWMSGSPNTGGGGGAGAGGGSGVVVIRYATPITSNTYPSTIQMDSLAEIQAIFRDIDINSLKGPGIGSGASDPMVSFAVATNANQTVSGVAPQPYTTNSTGQPNYIYQPLLANGSLCNVNLECTKFNLFYKTEVDGVVHVVTSVDQ